MQNNDDKCKNCIDSKLSIFTVLNEDEKILLSQNHECKNIKKGDIIYSEGEVPSGLICLSEGKAKIFKEGLNNREQIVRMAKPVGFIGYRALFAGDNYRSSAVAIEDSCICTIPKDNVYKVLRMNSELAIKIINYMARELGEANTRTVTLTQKHIRGRLADALLFLKETYGTEDDNATLKVYLSREDVANLSNMTTSNAIRTLSSFAGENVISINGRRIKILDLSQLERISEIG